MNESALIASTSFGIAITKLAGAGICTSQCIVKAMLVPPLKELTK